MLRAVWKVGPRVSHTRIDGSSWGKTAGTRESWVAKLGEVGCFFLDGGEFSLGCCSVVSFCLRSTKRIVFLTEWSNASRCCYIM